MLGQDDSFEYSKHRNSSSSDSFGNRDVIRIAYIPSIIGESPINNPEPSVQSGGVLKPNFSSLRNQEQDKHSSVASLDEAVVMAVTSKATPQVMRLNAIKANQSDLIQRSNTLHSSNSIKRTLSQRRIAETKINANASSTKPPSPLGDIHSMYDQDSDADPFYSVSGSKRSSSAPSMLSSYSTSNPFMTEAELSTSPTSFSSFSNNTRRTSTAKANSRSSNPFLSVAESTMSPSSTSGSFTPASSQPGSPMSDTTAVFASIPITFGDHYNEDDPLSGLPAPNLRPWTTSSESSAMRDSTFSTISDSRSSTRGDGEEIMIFWEGH
ncbi:hypothetical protein BGZ76_007470 [Entomortierella beljakovae]|nr:hypothetical protein BGZ76_007470 [Entomortierella beljakovae]